MPEIRINNKVLVTQTGAAEPVLASNVDMGNVNMSNVDKYSIGDTNKSYHFHLVHSAGNHIHGSADASKLYGNGFSNWSGSSDFTIFEDNHNIVNANATDIRFTYPKTGLWHLNWEFHIQNDGTGGTNVGCGVCASYLYLFTGNLDRGNYNTDNTEAWFYGNYWYPWSSHRNTMRENYVVHMTAGTQTGFVLYNAGNSRWSLRHFSGYLLAEVD